MFLWLRLLTVEGAGPHASHACSASPAVRTGTPLRLAALRWRWTGTASSKPRPHARPPLACPPPRVPLLQTAPRCGRSSRQPRLWSCPAAPCTAGAAAARVGCACRRQLLPLLAGSWQAAVCSWGWRRAATSRHCKPPSPKRSHPGTHGALGSTPLGPSLPRRSGDPCFRSPHCRISFSGASPVDLDEGMRRLGQVCGCVRVCEWVCVSALCGRACTRLQWRYTHGGWGTPVGRLLCLSGRPSPGCRATRRSLGAGAARARGRPGGRRGQQRRGARRQRLQQPLWIGCAGRSFHSGIASAQLPSPSLLPKQGSVP